MPRITIKGQVTIPRDIRNKFGYSPGTEVEIITKGNMAIITKSTRENCFIKWLGRGKNRKKEDIDQMIGKLRGRDNA